MSITSSKCLMTHTEVHLSRLKERLIGSAEQNDLVNSLLELEGQPMFDKMSVGHSEH